MSVSLSTHCGAAIEPFIDDLARLRIQIFRDFPYLYDGDMDYERNYLQTYLNSDAAAVVLARDGDQVVGASTCLPMTAEESAFQSPLRAIGLEPDNIFYLAESVLNSDYRGQGLGVGFFEQREAHAARLGGFSHACFCAVQRPDNHPLKPSEHVPLHGFWKKRGYAPTDAYASYTWQDVDQDNPTEKQLRFWMKEL